MSRNAYKVQIAKTAVKRAILHAAAFTTSELGVIAMESLTSPKITVGLHCLCLRTKSMFVTSVVDPAEATFYDSYETAAYWCVETQSGFGPDGAARPARCLLQRAGLLQVVRRAQARLDRNERNARHETSHIRRPRWPALIAVPLARRARRLDHAAPTSKRVRRKCSPAAAS